MKNYEIKAEEFANAYIELESRCMTQSSSWVLEFLIELAPEINFSIPPDNIKVSFAKTLFRNGEFKRVQFLLQNETDQKSQTIYFLSKLLDTQRQLQQSIPDDSTFIGDLAVSTKNMFEAYDLIVNEARPYVSNFDALNLYIFALMLTKSGKFEEALKYLIQSLNQFPLNHSGWKLLINILIRFDNNVIGNALSQLPAHITSEIFKIELKSQLQMEDASALFAKLNLPRVAPVIALEASIHYYGRNFEQSALLFAELRNKYPLRLESLELFSHLLFVKEDLAALSELAQKLVQIDKFRPETLTVLGNFFALSGRHEDAIEQFAMCLRFDSDFSFAWTLIGHEYIELQNSSAATAAYIKAFESNPRDFRALYGLGRAFELSRMPFHAILFYRKALTVNPSDSRLWMALGECYEELLQYENAIKCYQRAVCNTDSEGTAIYKLGKLYKETNEDDKAAFCFETFVGKKNVIDAREDSERVDNEREAVSFLANYYLAKKKIDKANIYANMMLQDPSMAQDGKTLMKDINALNKA
ncbi:TPR Domain containing protein [Trichomonas vaginalis G3]|uniref:TPR Domain containing protein n=1 Tax=Trichomonas vaginalis (strain ATCC PRA-98 / G3) TaxID=412133 RepID=A2DXD5_TRIV3|nr:cell division cycle 16,23,27 family [Trichomonas vaginalis G3]EAY14887.1 TPR Domain containing protein [Trichomonas vaginalis G3]KAI5485460.1 cell division cycle 16,23,27 family [Trichomonas vaginalis G3]|eukprot:XP_001327110.1 TPR Domain containing protein [Trichomonas vaginalis G3]